MLGIKLSQLSPMVIPMMTLNCKGHSTRGIFAPTLGATFLLADVNEWVY